MYTACASTRISNMCLRPAAWQQLPMYSLDNPKATCHVAQYQLSQQSQLHSFRHASEHESPVAVPAVHFISSSRARHRQQCHVRQSVVATTATYSSSSSCAPDCCKWLSLAACVRSGPIAATVLAQACCGLLSAFIIAPVQQHYNSVPACLTLLTCYLHCDKSHI